MIMLGHSCSLINMQAVELSGGGKRFLSHLFDAFDTDQDRVLSDAEQGEMFSASPSRYCTAGGVTNPSDCHRAAP